MLSIPAGLTGLLLGLLVAWLYGRSRIGALSARLDERYKESERLRVQAEGAESARRDVARLTAELEAERKAGAEKLAVLQDAEVRFREVFTALSADALAQSSQQFLDLAATRLGTVQESAKADLDARAKAIADLVKPMEDGLKKVDERLGTVEKERVDAYADLRRHVEEMGKGQAQLQGETQNLVKSLRAPQVRGAWGEIQLRRVVEMAGMLEHCDFNEQVTVGGRAVGRSGGSDDDEKVMRPDLVIRLPGGKCIVVDSKAPLSAYLEAMGTGDDGARALFLDQHAKQVRTHIGQLAAKSYWSQFPNAPDFVVMFLPGESFFSAACQCDPALIDHAVNQSVIPASPTTLITLLRTVQFGWRQERIAESAEEIRKLGQDLYDRLRVLAGHLQRVGNGLTSATAAYNEAVVSFESRALTGARRFTELGVGEGKEIGVLEPVDIGVRIPSRVPPA